MGVKNTKTNKAMSENHNKHIYHTWAKGFKQGGKQIYHPYTKVDFEFGNISYN